LFAGENPQEGEEGMMPAIRVVPRRKGEKMDNTSRIDYNRTYTVDHFVKVKEFGDVHEKYVRRLRQQWWIVVKKGMDAEDEDSDREDPPEEGTYKEWVTAKYDYDDPKMMKLKRGDRVGVLDYTTEAWWKGMNLRTGEVNLFPSGYVESDIQATTTA
jgi:hypothetical protein